MQGYQFAHVETWSVAGATGSVHHQSGQRKNGQTKWTTSEILDEAERVPGSCQHVELWRPGPQTIPGSCNSFDELRSAHANVLSVRESFDYTDPKTREKTTRHRKLRKDARTLYTAVFSLPVESCDALSDPDLRADCEALLGEAIQHEADRIEQLGGMHAMSVIHWDEDKVHAHFYALDPAQGRVSHLHPGEAAKQSFMADPSHLLRLDKQKLNKGGNLAYCAAMRDWQNTLHEEVFAPAGLLRFGPRRERMSRRDYLQARQAASERAADKERQRDLDLRGDDLTEFAQNLLETHEADMALRAEWSADLDLRSRSLDAYQENLIEDRNQLLADIEANVRREEEIEARAGMLSGREKVLDVREVAADERASHLDAREKIVANREADANAREADAEATLAAFEAVVDGVIEVDEAEDESLTVRPSADPALSEKWPGLKAKMAARPEAARAAMRRVHRRLEKIRTAARQEAAEKLANAFLRIEQTWTAARGLLDRLQPFVGKMSSEDQQDIADATKEEARLVATKTIAKREVEAAKRHEER